jgi:ubiquinol-cytochrome c reductase cytochrome b/c1 subunit
MLIATMAISFLGYTLPWGQMSLWGATVISSTVGIIPEYGDAIVEWLWGGYTVDNATLKRFFVFHISLPILLLGLSILHVYYLHLIGSTTPLPVESLDNTRFYPKYLVKDLFGLLIIGAFLFIFVVFFTPNALGHPDNYIMADPLATPKHIVPEWYFLPFYAILRSCPDKVGGVLSMVLAIVILFFTPFLGGGCDGIKLSITKQLFFWAFVFNYIFLGWLGSRPAEQPYLLALNFSTAYYFLYFILILPLSSKFGNNKNDGISS